MRQVDLFQFQTGAIKRHLSYREQIYMQTFQFQTGAIKSWMPPAQGWRDMFQFQTGAIKSTRKHLRHRIRASFNSKLVRLKVKRDEYLAALMRPAFQFQTGAIKSQTEAGSAAFVTVSIPNWCD